MPFSPDLIFLESGDERAAGSPVPGAGEGVKPVAWWRTGQLRVAGSKPVILTESPHLVPCLTVWDLWQERPLTDAGLQD